ncbi:hypothetical protein TPA0907_56540 [Micromonospora humidisoli]|uniref:DDE-type integrase/transposase/recombinase n=1 Tax=Micromonospora sp. AKA109 TaxID=2733865 RepID=UPI0022BAD475|nr:DDE-type integrase/transposase/recombinase [Micromonospora sp. AKA109]GHJ11287.1 hypothetical protein TPA0907_56540 [Micromonospora sp. AKA109]
MTSADEVIGTRKVIDVLVSARRDAAAARRFFTRAQKVLKTVPVEVVTDAAAVYPAVLADLIPAAWHHVERYANNPVEADRSRLKHRLRPMRGLRTDRTAPTVIAGHAFVQNLRRGHFEIATDTPARQRPAAAFNERAQAISLPPLCPGGTRLPIGQRNSAGDTASWSRRASLAAGTHQRADLRQPCVTQGVDGR